MLCIERRPPLEASGRWILTDNGRYCPIIAVVSARGARPPRGAMTLSKLSGDEQCIIFVQLCNTLDPGVAVAFSSASSELRTLTQALLQQLRADHEARKVLMQSSKELREAKELDNGPSAESSRRRTCNGLSAADLTLLGSLGSLLPALERLNLFYWPAGPGGWLMAGHDGMQRLMAGLGAGALPALTSLSLRDAHVGEAGASALAAALGRGALPRLKALTLSRAGIGDAGLVALAPALRRRPALEGLYFGFNPLGGEGLAALVAPPPPAGRCAVAAEGRADEAQGAQP